MSENTDWNNVLRNAIPADLAVELAQAASRGGRSEKELLEHALRQFLRSQKGGNALYMSAPVNALLEGFYEGTVTIAQLKERGDFGLGTFNELDGEMVVLDGAVYQVKADGNVYSVPDTTCSPFACVTFFNPITYDDVDGGYDHQGFLDLLANLTPSPNMLYAFRIDGVFDYVSTRSVPPQENYRPLVDVAQDQPTFEFHNTEGTLAGFYIPEFMGAINVPGYHLHFLTADRCRGGHLLRCHLRSARVGVQPVPRLDMDLPVTLDYLTADFSRDARDDLEKAEK